MHHKYNFETLESGAKAMFVNLPHFRTTSIRIVVRSGAFHEESNHKGSAHFLEHMTFAGTDDLPSQIIQEKYANDNDIYQNAFSDNEFTKYVVNGYDLDSAAFLIIQSVFRPLLLEKDFELQKQPVISEISSYLSDPHYKANIAHWLAVFGKEATCNITGEISDIKKMTHKDLVNFYDNNYRPENCWIIVCSGEDVKTQRNKINSLLSGINNKPKARETSETNKKIEFNPDGNNYSLIKVDIPKDSTTQICIYYPLDSPKDVFDRVRSQVLVTSLSNFIQSVLRTELDLVYGANCASDVNFDISFDNHKRQYFLRFFTEVIEDNVIKVLDAIKEKILDVDTPEHWVEAALKNKLLEPDYWLQDNPYMTIDNIVTSLIYNGISHIDFFEEKMASEKLKVSDINKLKKSVFNNSPVLTVSSPSQKVLDDIKVWTDKLK